MSGLRAYASYRDEAHETFTRIPEHWDVVRGRHLVRIRTGSGDTVDAEPDGEFPFYVRSDKPVRSDRWEFDTTAVLTAGDGAGVAKVFHLVTGRFMAHQRVYVLDEFRRVTPRFFYYAFSNLFHLMALDGSAKSTVDSVRRPMIADMPFAVPPLGEQRAIADYLDRETARIDTLIEEQQRLIELQWERRAAVVDAALSPLSSWTCTALKHVLDGIDQGVSPQAEAGLADEPGAWGVLKTGCVNRGVFRPEEHKRLPDGFPVDPAIAVEVGDVIVSRASGSPDLVGSAAIVELLEYRLILSDKLFRLRPRRSTDSRFLAWSLNSGRYRVQVRRAISGADGLANNLPLSKMRGFEMRFPSLEEQQRIAAYLDDQTAKIDMLIVETERFIELARERRSALITAAVTGQIDAREVA